MAKFRYNKRYVSKLRKKLALRFPGLSKSYNIDLMQKYAGLVDSGYPRRKIKYSSLVSTEVYMNYRNDLVKVNSFKKDNVFKYYKKFKQALSENNISKANKIIQDLYNGDCYFSYEFSKLIRNEFLNRIKLNYKDFDSDTTLRLINQLTYRAELEVLGELSKLFYDNDVKLLNSYIKQVIMEIKLSTDNSKEKLCIEYKDFSI